jgi:hypothetical protein
MRFFFWFFAMIKHISIGKIISLLSVFDFVLEFANLFKFLTFGDDSVDMKSHSLSTESVPSETPR